jgi:glycosyltransferase involved in cell wall biosynthesis
VRLFVIENNLQDKIGHFFNLSLGLKTEAERRGVATRFYVHRGARRDVTRPLGARPAFRYRSADHPSTHPLYGPVEDLLEIGRSFARSCRHLTHDGVRADDVVFVPTAQQNELYGVACWLATLPPHRRPFLFFNFHWAGFLDPCTGAQNSWAPLYRFATEGLLSQSERERVVFTAPTDVLAQQVGEVTGHPVHRYPLPYSYAFADGARPSERSGDQRPVVAMMGRSLPRKGTGILPDLVRAMAEQPSRVRFSVQLTEEFDDLRTRADLQELAARDDVDIVRGVLSEVEYYERLAVADIVLLPYGRAEYATRPSGVFCEAAGLGKVAVVPSGTWMATQITAGRAAGTMFDTDDVEAVADAVNRAASSLPELLADARDRAPAWREEESASAYLDRMIEQVGTIATVG